MTPATTISAIDSTRLQAYLDELARWNARMNLTAVGPERAWQRHVGETLTLLAAVSPNPGDRCIDVGSGGGVPGIPMAILRSDIEIVLLDADRRKAGFLTHVCGLLRLTNASAEALRAEDAGRDPAHRERYDLAVSRATAAAPALCELCLPLVRVGGRFAAMLRSATEAALEARAAALACGGAEPTAEAEEVMVVAKHAPCDDRYPRRPGVPARRPITGRIRGQVRK